MPATNVDELLALLEQECRTLGDLLALLGEENLALQANDIEGLKRLAPRKDAMLAAFGGVEARRLGLSSGDGRTLGQIAAEAGPDRGQKLFSARARLAERVASVKLAMRSNARMFNQGLECVRAVMEALRYPEGRLELYGPKAEAAEAEANPVFELRL